MATGLGDMSAGGGLPDQVASVLAAEIRQGGMAAGDKLPTEAALVLKFGVSRTVVREAISRLKSLGLVDSRRGSGVYLKPAGFSPLNFDSRSAVSKHAVIQMVEVRRALEGEVAELAARRRSPADLQRIRQSFAVLNDAMLAGGDGVDEDVQYHRAIAAAAANPFLVSTLDYLGQFLRDSTCVTRANEARRSDFAQQQSTEHVLILQAIEAGDGLAARVAASQHMDNAIGRIEQADPAFWEQTGMQLASPLVAGFAASAGLGRNGSPR